uniref:Ig-like domain-containing protein n=1 Tax=Glossina brevipalpis TaxID=37001 RepID=A0A1A9WX62_9MUSC
MLHIALAVAYKRDPPEIIKKPQNQGVRVGGVASFYCAARGDPPPSIVWRKNGKKVSGTQSRYTVLEQTGGVSILRIEPVRAGRDDAPYECVAENGVGDAVIRCSELSSEDESVHVQSEASETKNIHKESINDDENENHQVINQKRCWLRTISDFDEETGNNSHKIETAGVGIVWGKLVEDGMHYDR